MGNAHSPAADPCFVSATRAFTQKELEDLKSLFVSLAAQSQSNGQHISPSVFKEYIGVRGPLADRMFELVTQKRSDHTLTFEDLVIAKGTYEKGTKEEIEEFMYQLSDVSGDGTLGRSDLEAVLTAMLETIFSHRSAEPGSASCQETVHIFLDAAKFSEAREGCTGNSMSFEDFRTWCTLLPSVRKFLGSLLMPSDPGSQVPRLLHPENIDSSVLLLREEYAWHIGGALPQLELDDWKLLYHSAVNGLSFNTFLGNISNDDGPTLLIIKDKEGYIYGGYASQPWQRHADFYGDMKSFLFQLYPQASIFRPTGANSNLQWSLTSHRDPRIKDPITQISFSWSLTSHRDPRIKDPITQISSSSSAVALLSLLAGASLLSSGVCAAVAGLHHLLQPPALQSPAHLAFPPASALQSLACRACSSVPLRRRRSLELWVSYCQGPGVTSLVFKLEFFFF